MLSPRARYRHSDPAIYLVGPMGSGKSTIGRQLARKLHTEFIDVDREVEHRMGRSISQIFKNEGEEYFREFETSVIEEVAARTGIVVATGGGAILRQQNRSCLRNGIVVYLHATVEQQYERVKNSTHRPLLEAEDPKEVLSDLQQTRDPLYRSEADIIMRTDNQSTQDVVKKVEHALMTL